MDNIPLMAICSFVLLAAHTMLLAILVGPVWKWAYFSFWCPGLKKHPCIHSLISLLFPGHWSLTAYTDKSESLVSAEEDSNRKRHSIKDLTRWQLCILAQTNVVGLVESVNFAISQLHMKFLRPKLSQQNMAWGCMEAKPATFCSANHTILIMLPPYLHAPYPMLYLEDNFAIVWPSLWQTVPSQSNIKLTACRSAWQSKSILRLRNTHLV